jgi:hypothetical protein
MEVPTYNVVNPSDLTNVNVLKLLPESGRVSHTKLWRCFSQAHFSLEVRLLLIGVKGVPISGINDDHLP